MLLLGIKGKYPLKGEECFPDDYRQENLNSERLFLDREKSLYWKKRKKTAHAFYMKRLFENTTAIMSERSSCLWLYRVEVRQL